MASPRDKKTFPLRVRTSTSAHDDHAVKRLNHSRIPSALFSFANSARHNQQRAERARRRRTLDGRLEVRAEREAVLHAGEELHVERRLLLHEDVHRAPAARGRERVVRLRAREQERLWRRARQCLAARGWGEGDARFALWKWFSFRKAGCANAPARIQSVARQSITNGAPKQ